MPLEWTQALSVGVEHLNAHHRELFRRVGRLLGGLHRGEPGEIEELVRYLHEYVVTHFRAEEERMRAERYPGYARHKAQHDHFVSDLLAIAAEHAERGGGAFMALRVNHWLSGWLREHISGADGEMGRFLARRTA